MFSRADECPSDRYWITTSRAGERNIKERDGPGGATPNAQVQQRGQNRHRLLTEPPRCNAPLSPRLLQPLVRGGPGEGTGIHLLFA
jgi:hypothetical protein